MSASIVRTPELPSAPQSSASASASDVNQSAPLPFAELLTLASQERALGFSETGVMGLSHANAAALAVTTTARPSAHARPSSDRGADRALPTLEAIAPAQNGAPAAKRQAPSPSTTARSIEEANDTHALASRARTCAYDARLRDHTAATTKQTQRQTTRVQLLNAARSAVQQNAVAISLQATTQGLLVLARVPGSAGAGIDHVRLGEDVQAVLAEHGLTGALSINGRRVGAKESERDV